MIGKQVLNQTPVTLPEVQRLIDERKKEGELTYEQNLTLEYAKKFVVMKEKDAKALVEELTKLEKVGATHASALTDLMPKTVEEVQLIFSRDHFVLSDEEITQILDVLTKYRKA